MIGSNHQHANRVSPLKLSIANTEIACTIGPTFRWTVAFWGAAGQTHRQGNVQETVVMDMSGSYDIPAPREVVYAALNNIDVLQACIPGCESITKRSDTELEAIVSAKVGPVKAKFTGTVILSDLDPPNGYTISGEGKGGAAGFAKGGAKVILEPSDTGTILRYEVTAQVGGKLAQIGSRLIDSTAQKMANQFFSQFSKKAPESISSGKPQITTLETAKPVTEDQKTASLKVFKPISYKIWLPMMVGIFALIIIWLTIT